MNRMLLILALMATAVAGVQSYRLQVERTAHAETKATAATQWQDYYRESNRAIQAARDEEQRRTTAIQEIANDAQKQLDVARDDANAARSAGERLRNRVAELTAAIGRTGGKHSTAASTSPPTQATADLLADVQRRLDAAADGIAGFADQAHTTGTACERTYDAMSAGGN